MHNVKQSGKNKKRQWMIIGIIGVLSLLLMSYQLIFDVPEQPILTDDGQLHSTCIENPSSKAIDNNGQIQLLVWNVYKEQRDNLLSALSDFSQHKQLVLLQEASMTVEMDQWIEASHWESNQVQAFKAFNTAAGVLNLTHQPPLNACAYTAVEPWLRLPKSAIWAQYRLSDGDVLAVVNIHAINFTLETKEYRQQLQQLAARIKQHQQPIIVAGDFNSWSEERVEVMKQAFITLGLKEVTFSPDNRLRFMGQHPLDHVFYKGLQLKEAKVPQSDASDHNPLLVHFELMPNQKISK